MHSHKELIVWQKGMAPVTLIYRVNSKFPKEEMYGLTSQIRRAAISIPSNIAEGRCRSSKKDYLQFLRIANGSSAELETQLLIAKELSFIDEFDYNRAYDAIIEIMRMLRAMIQKLNPNKTIASTASLKASPEASEANEAN
ncbi:MAG: four helix bundle protein [Candidatus Vogelbacteria bacterium]|nr:four helix bundle protein [Candidatus Vogelbacteria bacterium]